MARGRSLALGEATERPTPERQREARRLGQVAVSADLSAALALGAVLVVFVAAAPAGITRLLQHLRGALEHAASAPDGAAGLSAAGSAALAVAVPLVVLPAAAALAILVLVGAVQTGGLFAWGAARPLVGRVSPRAGLGRLFSGETAVQGGRSLLKVALVFAVAATVLIPVVRALPELVRANPATVLVALGQLGLRVATRVVVALVAWGVVDWVVARWRHQRAVAMTRDEVRREQKEREGDPGRRAERRRLHRELTEQSLPEDVRGADFVIVGGAPGGVVAAVAVAVVYQPSNGRAPLVMVAGRGPLAERLEQLAREAAVAVHHDHTLAVALVDVPAGNEIPEASFDAVAALLRPTVVRP